MAEASASVVDAVVSLMSNKGTTAANKKRPLIENTNIHTKDDLIEGLRNGDVSGSAVIEWKDTHGALRANVIDFILNETVIANDPKTNDKLRVKTEFLLDGTWRLLV